MLQSLEFHVAQLYYVCLMAIMRVAINTAYSTISVQYRYIMTPVHFFSTSVHLITVEFCRRTDISSSPTHDIPDS